MNKFVLKPGARIGVMAPSSFVEKEDIEKSTAVMEARGYQIYVHPQTYTRHFQSAGEHQDKLDALHELYADEHIDAIWCAGGGNRALYLCDHLDIDLIAANPKPLIGFSDVTALLNPILAQAGHIGWHAQVFKRLHEFGQLAETLAVFSGASHCMPLDGAKILTPGKAEGVLMGGCLSLFHYLPGTNDCPNLQGALLFLEDTGDEINRFDRMFAHMARMGVFEQIGGLILGEFHDVLDTGRPFGFTLTDIVEDVLSTRDIPVIINAPFGHGKNLWPLPVGRKAVLDTANKALSF